MKKLKDIKKELEKIIPKKDIPIFFAHFKSITQNHKIEEHNPAKLKEDSDPSEPKVSLPKNEYGDRPIISSVGKIPKHKTREATLKVLDHQTNNHNITPEEHESVMSYTGSSYHINRKLVDDHPDKIGRDVKGIDSAISKPEHKLKGAITSYAGISGTYGSILSGVKAGERVKSPAYASSSASHEVAYSFAHANPITKSSHMIVFHTPKGHGKALYVDKISMNAGEHEVIHARGQTFKKVGEHTVENHDRKFFSDKGTLEPSTITYHHLEPTED